MIEAIKEIGEYAVKGKLDRDVFLDGICGRLNVKKKTKKARRLNGMC